MLVGQYDSNPNLRKKVPDKASGTFLRSAKPGGRSRSGNPLLLHAGCRKLHFVERKERFLASGRVHKHQIQFMLPRYGLTKR